MEEQDKPEQQAPVTVEESTRTETPKAEPEPQPQPHLATETAAPEPSPPPEPRAEQGPPPAAAPEPESGQAQPVAARPDELQPVAARPDELRPQAARPEEAQPSGARPEESQPQAARPEEAQAKQDFGAILADFEQSSPERKDDPAVGKRVSGKVVSIRDESVFVDLGTKSEGVIEAAQLRDSEGKLTVAVGDKVDATVASVDSESGLLVLKKRVGGGRGHQEVATELRQAFQYGMPVEGMV